MTLFSSGDLDKLAALHVQRVWCAHFHLPGGDRRLHTGMGRLVLGGEEWEGVSDPFGGQLCAISGMEESRFGQAVAVDIVLAGSNRAFLKSMWDDRAAIEGVAVDLYFAVMDAETGEVLIPLKKVLPGKLTSPRFSMKGASIRAIAVKIVSRWEGLNFAATGAMWSPTGQRQRYAGDKGLDFINAEIVEVYKR